MASSIASFTIIKPGGLLSSEGGKSLLLAGHNDGMRKPRQVVALTMKRRLSLRRLQ